MTAMETCQEFLDRCLLFDIEINEKQKIYAIGASFRGETLSSPSGRQVGEKFLQDLDCFAAEAGYILGHNILSHDIPQLHKAFPSLRFINKSAVDTLYLSPLAFPENPYHRLIKDYQIVRDSVNDPVQDAILAGNIFSEQWQAFQELKGMNSDVPILYRSFLHNEAQLKGCADALGAMGIGLLEGDDLYESFSCLHAVSHVLRQLRGL